MQFFRIQARRVRPSAAEKVGWLTPRPPRCPNSCPKLPVLKADRAAFVCMNCNIYTSHECIADESRYVSDRVADGCGNGVGGVVGGLGLVLERSLAQRRPISSCRPLPRRPSAAATTAQTN
ncbi:hypothetical protein E2C01_019467 [Portunus trituberculatus]|uniref:Uncharacterized protein n=1 Tax=Portunus trituberculatus TaxID=210409 RepID=A0A5B7DX99_PORTR|nr:hypothetical protein [Portunus trituberculatus]